MLAYVTCSIDPWFSQNRHQNLGIGATEKHSFLSNYWFMIFTNKIIHSDTWTPNVIGIGIDVIIIGITQQQKLKFSLLWEILTKLCNSPSQNIPFFQNAISWILMNTIIRSILTLFTSCKQRHQCCIIRYHSNFQTTANFFYFFH